MQVDNAERALKPGSYAEMRFSMPKGGAGVRVPVTALIFREDGMQVVFAEVPLAETFTYVSQLRALTHGRGAFEMSNDRYEPVPSVLSKQIQDAAVKHHVEDEE